jgi:hypothetical protein
VLQAKEHTLTPSLSVVFTFGLAIKSIKELGGASHVLKTRLRLNFEHVVQNQLAIPISK